MAETGARKRRLGDVLGRYPGLPAAPVSSWTPEATAGREAFLVVLDDDPTGTQSVADLPVLTRWGVDDLEWALSLDAGAVYVETNTRGLDAAAAARINREVVLSATEVARRHGRPLTFVSRGDSTLRGHFPLETDAIVDAEREAGSDPVDAIVIVPAFPAAGRVTVGAWHWIRQGEELTPVAETEYARDATFGFQTSDLREYVSQKSGGRIAPEEVEHLGLDVVRAGPSAVSASLRSLSGARPVVADAVTDEDLDSLAMGLRQAEHQGKRFLYRVGPPFVRALLGQRERAPLTSSEIFGDGDGDGAGVGGLIVVGSHVPLTSRQLDHLMTHRDVTQVELLVERIMADSGSEAYLAEVTSAAVEGLLDSDTVLSTSRTLVTGDSAESSLRIAQRVSDFVIAVVAGVVAQARPRFVVAKGGITSSRVVAEGLGVTRAVVRGPLRPGIISLWELKDGPVAGTPYIVFPGNTGGDEDLSRVVDIVSAARERRAGMGIQEKTGTVAVIGLGAMGLPMAQRLATRFEVSGFDPDAGRRDLGAAAGVTPADSAAAACEGAGTVIVAVRDEWQLRELLFSAEGIAQSLAAGTVVVVTSTIGIDAVRDVAQRLALHGVETIDAPLSGGPARAGRGELLIVVGAAPAVLDGARTVLETLASTLTHIGHRPGDGQAFKTVNQLLCGVHIAAAAEALALAKALGLDGETVLSSLSAGAASSFMLADRGPRMLLPQDGPVEVMSRVDIFVKDMGIVTSAARRSGVATPVASVAEQSYLLAAARGLGAQDDSSVIRLLSQES